MEHNDFKRAITRAAFKIEFESRLCEMELFIDRQIAISNELMTYLDKYVWIKRRVINGVAHFEKNNLLETGTWRIERRENATWIEDGDVFGFEFIYLEVDGIWRTIAICCETYDDMDRAAVSYVRENLEFFNSGIILDNIKPKYRNINGEITIEITDNDTNAILYDCADCPVCMTGWSECEKHLTSCGHPICMECITTISKLVEPKCPICRQNYEENGDIEINADDAELTEELVDMMKENRNGLIELLRIVDLPGLRCDIVNVDGYSGLFGADLWDSERSENFYCMMRSA